MAAFEVPNSPNDPDLQAPAKVANRSQPLQAAADDIEGRVLMGRGRRSEVRGMREVGGRRSEIGKRRESDL